METWKDVALLTALGAFGKAMMGASYRSTDFEVKASSPHPPRIPIEGAPRPCETLTEPWTTDLL
jgi:hypothetical protein